VIVTADLPFKLDFTDFIPVFEEYRKVNGRKQTVAVNTKLFYIARRAVRETPSADRANILAALEKSITATRHIGPRKGTSGPLPFKIARAQRRIARMNLATRQAQTMKRGARNAGGRNATYRQLLKTVMTRQRGSNLRSIAYLKSGWLPAIQGLEPLAEKRSSPDMGAKPKRYGQPKGRFIPAVPGDNPTGLIANSIGLIGKRAAKQNAALMKFAGPALQRAINAETASMLEYLERKALEAAKEIGITAKQ